MSIARLTLILPALLLAACAEMGTQGATARPDGDPTPPTPEEIQKAATITSAPAPRPAARASAAQLDTTTAEQRAEAAKPSASAETKLGTTVASLGDATQPGFWIKTPLVKEKSIGRIVNPANGKSAKVDLLPLAGGGGSQVSLPALQLLGISLTELPTIEVYRS